MTDRVICCPQCGHEFRLEDTAGAGEPLRIANRPGAKFCIALRPGESAAPHPSGNGYIIVHPEHPPVWWREEGETVFCERLEPAEPGGTIPVLLDLYRARSFG